MPVVHMTRRAGLVALGVLVVLSGCAMPQRVGGAVQKTPAPASSTSAPGPAARPAAVPAKTSKAPSKVSLTCSQTANQLAVETALAAIGRYGPVTVDGHQTSADCETIKAFQRRMGILPANGRADNTTANVAKRIAATDVSTCKAGTATVACVDLTHQTFYIMKGGEAVVGPTVTRTGMLGFATPAGNYTVTSRALKSFSNKYQVWMPYWQHFHSGMGLHETTTYIHRMSIGSHGCVNLLRVDAIAAYSILDYGSPVRVFGRRPGT